jgi:phage-related protein
MPVTAAVLQAKVQLDDAQARSGMSRMKEEAGSTGGFMQNVFGFAGGQLLAGGITMAAGAIVGQFQDVFAKTNELQNLMTQTNTVLKSTGDVSGMTAQSVDALAVSLSKTTPFSREATTGAENMLLTFTNIGKNVFPQATQTVLDMSQALGQDLKSSSIQLGKALGDPTTGMTALARVGVTFDAQQKAQIKTMQASGDMMGAQKVILTELHKEFGNSAEAAGGTFAGKMAILNNQFDDVKTTIGGALMPVLSGLLMKVAPLVTEFAEHLPSALAKVGDFLSQNVMPVLKQLGDYVQTNVVPVLKRLGEEFITNIVPALKQFAQFIATNVVPVVKQLADFFITVLLPIYQKVGAALMSQLGPAFAALQAAFKSIMPVLGQLFDNLKGLAPFLEILAGILGGIVLIAIGLAIGAIRAIIGALKGIIEIVTNVVGFLRGAWDLIVGIFTGNGDLVKKALGEMGSAIIGVFKGLWDGVKGLLQGFWDGVSGFFTSLFDHLVGHSVIPDMITGIVTWFASLPGKVFGGIASFVTNLISSFVSMAIKIGDAVLNGILTIMIHFGKLEIQGLQIIKNALSNIISAVLGGISSFASAGAQMIGGLISGITNAVGGAVQAAKNAAQSVLDGVKNLFGIHSPSTVFAELGGHLMGGMAMGITDNKHQVGNALKGVLPTSPLQIGTMMGSSSFATSASGGIVGGGSQGTGTQNITIMLDSAVLTRTVLKNMPQQVRLATGIRGA